MTLNGLEKKCGIHFIIIHNSGPNDLNGPTRISFGGLMGLKDSGRPTKIWAGPFYKAGGNEFLNHLVSRSFHMNIISSAENFIPATTTFGPLSLSLSVHHWNADPVQVRVNASSSFSMLFLFFCTFS